MVIMIKANRIKKANTDKEVADLKQKGYSVYVPKKAKQRQNNGGQKPQTPPAEPENNSGENGSGENNIDKEVENLLK